MFECVEPLAACSTNKHCDQHLGMPNMLADAGGFSECGKEHVLSGS